MPPSSSRVTREPLAFHFPWAHFKSIIHKVVYKFKVKDKYHEVFDVAIFRRRRNVFDMKQMRSTSATNIHKRKSATITYLMKPFSAYPRSSSSRRRSRRPLTPQSLGLMLNQVKLFSEAFGRWPNSKLFGHLIISYLSVISVPTTFLIIYCTYLISNK